MIMKNLDRNVSDWRDVVWSASLTIIPWHSMVVVGYSLGHSGLCFSNIRFNWYWCICGTSGHGSFYTDLANLTSKDKKNNNCAIQEQKKLRKSLVKLIAINTDLANLTSKDKKNNNNCAIQEHKKLRKSLVKLIAINTVFVTK